MIQLGDGRQTSLFWDRWLGNKSIVDLIGAVDEVACWGRDNRVRDCWQQGRWSIPPSFMHRYPHVAERIQGNAGTRCFGS